MAKIKPQAQKASSIPLWSSLVSFFLSLGLAALPFFKLVTNSEALTSLIGWALTPVATFTLYGLDFYLQHRPSNASRFSFRPDFSRILLIIAYASLGLCVAHVWRLAELWSVVA